MKDNLVLSDNLSEAGRNEIYDAMINTVVKVAKRYASSRAMSIPQLVEKVGGYKSISRLLEGRRAFPTGVALERLMSGADLYKDFVEEVPVKVNVEKTPPTPGWLKDDRPIRAFLELSSWMYLEATRRYLRAYPPKKKGRRNL
jgi:antitoxin component HigA of HigAB toxin-antitoxin module